MEVKEVKGSYRSLSLTRELKDNRLGSYHWYRPLTSLTSPNFFNFLLFLLLSASLLHAEEVTLEPVQRRSPTARTLLFGIGRTHQFDTYLSPMEYKGLQVSFMTQSERMTHLLNRHVSFQSTLFGAYSYTENPSETANYMGGRLAYDAGWHYHYSPLPHLNLKGGALIGTDLGFLYNNRNGNNPAQGRFSIDLSLSAGADYTFKLKRLPMRVSYQADLPMLGLMFCPEFDESYYEISQRGVGHDIICAHPGNALSLRQMLTMDFCLRRVTLRIAYLYDVRQQNARNLKYHDRSHSFMLGFVRHFQLMKRTP